MKMNQGNLNSCHQFVKLKIISSYYDALACANLPTYSESDSSNSSDSNDNTHKKRGRDNEIEYNGYDGFNDFNDRQNNFGGEGW